MAEGEAIYRREQCDRCHTTFDAPVAAEPAALPVPRLPQPTDSRVGPDLGLEGHRRSDDWHAAHLYAPDVLVPGTRMPASRHLFLPGSTLPPRLNEDGRALVAWLQALGRRERDVWSELRAQDPPIPPPERSFPGAQRGRGKALYAAWCVPCHGVAGDGRGPAAALLALPPRDLTRAEFRFRSTPLGTPATDADLFRTLTLGSGTGAAMPSFAFLDAEDRWALVRVVRDFAQETRGAALMIRAPETSAAPAAGAPAASGPDAARGARLYTDWGCAACHGTDGEGRALAAAETDGVAGESTRGSELRHACARRAGGSAAAFERALRHGVGPTMPSYATVLDREPGAVRAILTWLESRDREAATAPGDAAGASPGRGTTGSRSSR